MSDTPAWHERSGQLTLGVAVRTLGAFASGWRMPGAHSDPADDVSALKRVAAVAEAAAFDFLYFGDWLSTGAELELTDPHLLVRTDPLSTPAFLAAVTSRIGLVGTVSLTYTEPYAAARTAASIDLLSEGRFGLNLLIGSDPRAAANFSATPAGTGANRFAVAEEYVTVLRGLWASVQPALFSRDSVAGRLIDSSRLRALEHHGESFSVRGPLNTLPPIQGSVPLAFAGSSPRARAFAATVAEVYLTSPSSLGEAIKAYRDMGLLVEAAGRARGDLKVVAPLLPLVAPTRRAAQDLYDQLVSLTVLHGDAGAPDLSVLGAHRTAAHITQLVGLPLSEREFDDPVTPADSLRFNAAGRKLLEIDEKRSGRVVGSRRVPTYRHLLVAQLIDAPVVVGSPADIADTIETWYRSSAVDGFTILSAYLHEQFESFAELVLPELRRRGLFREQYEGTTLREHLRTAAPARAGSTAAPVAPAAARRPCDTGATS
ncbi:NtaA/DmoA family FMN-dependent monooxygenase [Subtercola endophyticus]|uniref:NtaA/DmoA family FMN-dependent monooxygenase n=1 Tax=Subtercola endophyticus TaxID=2895559 RepID=UPI001E385F33|nr:NtaA/DmoA family FMN-dependent monooxygenase [Subtercola endophyticus]UFS59143.1 NtaA/DmoA family FMN-dependent monooxygenase [Subtercola endophyticus]